MYEKELECRNAQSDEAWKECLETGQYVSHEDMVAYLDTWGRNIDILPPIQKA